MITSCNFFAKKESNEDNGKPLARVYDKYLYFDEVKDIIPKDLNEKDSLAFLQNYINIWAKDQLMIYKAEYNLTEDQKDFSKAIEEYRNDLLKFTYKQEYVKENLDTNIADTAIANYYKKAGSDNFSLQQSIVIADYAVIKNEAPELKKAIKWFSSNDKKDQEKLQDYLLKYAYKFSLNDSSWVSFERVKKIIPDEEINQADFLKNHKYLQYKDDINTYLLHIKDYKLKGDLAPLSYAKGIIKNVLINRKKLSLLSKLEQNLLKDAMKKNEFETY